MNMGLIDELPSTGQRLVLWSMGHIWHADWAGAGGTVHAFRKTWEGSRKDSGIGVQLTCGLLNFWIHCGRIWFCLLKWIPHAL